MEDILMMISCFFFSIFVVPVVDARFDKSIDGFGLVFPVVTIPCFQLKKKNNLYLKNINIEIRHFSPSNLQICAVFCTHVWSFEPPDMIMRFWLDKS